MGPRRDDEATAAWRPGADGELAEPATIPNHREQEPPSPPSTAAPDLDATGLPARFEPLAMLGRGGMGRVLRVHDRSLNREVAVKIVRAHQDEHARLRFLREARAAGTLRHPNIVTVHDVAPDGAYLVMELVQGESLAGLLKRERKLPAAEVRRIGASLLDALGAAHRAGIIHRDIKPANILIDPAGTVKLTDFGIASFGDSELTSTGQLIGTPAYMAPEQLRARRVDERADVYGAGATLFEAATGLVLNSKHSTVEDPWQAVVDATGDVALAAVVTKAVRDKEAERFADVAAFAEALARTMAQPPTEAKAPAPARRRWPFAVAGIAITAGIAGALAVHALGGHPSDGLVAARVTTIAILPFENHVGDPRLDFAGSGLAHLLGEQLGRIDGLRVLGYYRVRAGVKAPDDPAAWRVAARELGASLIVRGELEPAGDLARVTIVVERSDGTSLDRVAREVAIDQVPESVRALAATVATAALGAPARGALAMPRAFDVERELQLGVAAFERQEFDAARGHLTAAVARDSGLSEADYYLALLDWWQSKVPTEHIQRALDGSLDRTAREFLVGLQLLFALDYPRAVDYFRDLARRAPDQRDVQYGLFEALYHGGHAAEAVEAYRRLRDLAPGFYVGVEHAMSYYLARGDVAGIRWTREHWDVPLAERALWDARAKMAVQDYPEAIKILERAQEEEPGSQTSIARDLVAAYAVTGQLALARELTARADDAGFWALARYGIAITGGQDGARSRTDAVQAVNASIPGMKLWEGWFDLVALDLVAAKPRTLHEDLDVYAAMEGHVATIEIGSLILAQRLAGSRPPSTSRVQVFPQAVAVATAIAADTRRDSKAAAEAWRRVIELDDDGRAALYARSALARDLSELGDHAGVIATCDEVITPRVFTWAWANGVGPCLRASAEAAAALGRSDDARRRWERLLALRSSAISDDELVRAARAALAR